MREGWREVPLSDVVTIHRRSTAPSSMPATVELYSIPGLDAGIAPETVAASEIGSNKFEIESRSLLISLLNPRIPRQTLAVPGSYGSTEFAVITTDESRLDLDYLALITSGGNFQEHLVSRAKGTTGSRSRSKAADVLAFRIGLPPLAEQRRIVDLIGALDDTIAAAETSRLHLETTLVTTARDLLPVPTPAAAHAIVDLCARSIGGVWGKKAGEAAVDALAFRSTEFSDWGYVVHRKPALRGLTEREYMTRRLHAGDILIEKSGGTPTRPVGRVVQFHERDLHNPAIGTNFMQIVSPDPSLVLPRFLFWTLWSNHRRGGSRLFQQASTNIRNLQTRAYLEQRIDLPNKQWQSEVANLLDRMLQVRQGISSTVQTLRKVRASLLTVLLSGEHEIPEAYDEVLEAAA